MCATAPSRSSRACESSIPAPGTAAAKDCGGVPVNKITALRANGTDCGDAKAVAKKWHSKCQAISAEFFCDPNSLKLRGEKPFIVAKKYKCRAEELDRTATKAKHKVTCTNPDKKITFKHVTTRSS
jgi:hypothetical protein